MAANIINGYRVKNDGSVWEIHRRFYCDQWHETYTFKKLFSRLDDAIAWAKHN